MSPDDGTQPDSSSNPSSPASAVKDSNSISADLLSILVCPLTRSPLTQEGEYLVAEVGGLKYPIRDSLPVLLIEEASLPDGIESLAAFKEKYKAEIPDVDQL